MTTWKFILLVLLASGRNLFQFPIPSILVIFLSRVAVNWDIPLKVQLDSSCFFYAIVFGLSQTLRTTAEHPSHKCFIYLMTVFIPWFPHIWILFNILLVDVEERETALMLYAAHCCQYYAKHKLIMSDPACNFLVISPCLQTKPRYHNTDQKISHPRYTKKKRKKEKNCNKGCCFETQFFCVMLFSLPRMHMHVFFRLMTTHAGLVSNNS